MKVLKCIAPLALMISGVLFAPGLASASQWHGHHHHQTYVCSGGNIPSGDYNSVLVTGLCYTPSGNVNIEGDLTVAPGALFDAVTSGDPTSTPIIPATVNIDGNVFVGTGAVFLFGCSPNITCTNPPALTYDSIGGSLYADGALGVVIHSASIGGSVSVLGGGGGTAADTCNAQDPSQPTVTNLEPWSEDATLDFTPVYTDVEDSTIGGSLTVAGLNSCWLGVISNQINGSARVFGNTMGDPDAMEVTTNLVLGNLACLNNSPAVQFGDGAGAPDVVQGHAFGECAFSVLDQNPNPAAGPTNPSGIYEHISVPFWKLGIYHGTYSAGTAAVTLPTVTTNLGDALNASIYSFTLSGTGLTGGGTYDSTMPPGASGAAIVSTTYPDGWTKFTGYLTCACSFGGQSGTVSIRVYGTTSPHGHTSGDFFIYSSGGVTTGTLGTLAGGGTFTNHGEPAGSLALTEYLLIS